MFKLPTLQIDIENNNSDLSLQERLVIEQHYFSLGEIIRATERLDDKALSLLEAAGLILALIGALEFPRVFTDDPTWWVKGGIAVSFLAFIGMILLLTRTYGPADFFLPGSQDWNRIFNKYVNVKRDDSYNKILSDCLEAYDRLLTINLRKATNLNWAIFLFVVQIAGLLTVAMFS